MGRNYNQLLDQAKRGEQIGRDDLEDIRSQLLNRQFEADPYTLLHILGICGGASNVPIVQQYIGYDSGDSENDGMIRRMAIVIWGRMWARPEAWDAAVAKAFNDRDRYVRAAAATIIGFLGNRYLELRANSAATLLKGLNEYKSTDVYTWESFYYGLLELLGTPPSEYPSVSSALTPQDIRVDVIERAKSIARQSSLDERASL